MSFYADRWWRDSTTALKRLEERVNGESEARSKLREEFSIAIESLEASRESILDDLRQTAGGLVEVLDRTDRIVQTMGALAASHVELIRTVAALQRPSLGRRILARARTYVGKT